MSTSEELRSLARRLSTLAQIAALAEQPNLFHSAEKRRSNFLRDEIAQAAEELRLRVNHLEAPTLPLRGENE